MKTQALIFGTLVLLSVLVSAGCSKPASDSATSDGIKTQGSEPVTMNPDTPDAPVSTPASGTGSGGGITPMAGVGAGGMAPVAGTESLQGGGSGVGQVMKEKAKDVAARGGGSVGSVGEDGQ
jgi:ABC-type oligopeptide transport system substrate-binding subunit